MKNLVDVAEPIDISIENLLQKSNQYILADKQQEFEMQFELILWNRKFSLIDTLLTNSLEFFNDLADLIINTGEYIEPKKKNKFVLEIESEILNAKINLIKRVSKKSFDLGGKEWGEIRKKSISLREKYTTWRRRHELLIPETQEAFEATLMWMAAKGCEEDLRLLKKVRKTPPYSSKIIKNLFIRAEKEISTRLLKEPKKKTLTSEENKWSLSHGRSMSSDEIYDLKEKDIALLNKASKVLGNQEIVQIDENVLQFKNEIFTFVDDLISVCEKHEISESDYNWIIDTIFSWESFLKVHFLDFKKWELPYITNFLKSETKK